jgi:hypothetical protein
MDDFGPQRFETGKWKDIYPSNTFIGNYLRLDIMCREKLFDKMLVDIEGYFYGMAESTGTLWEIRQPTGSFSHGFASHVAVWIKKIFENR